jgi:hypothetical protein
MVLIMTSCRSQSPLTPATLDPELERLLADISLFPSEWKVDIPPFPYYWLKRAEASAMVQFRLHDSYALAQHTLFRYPDATKAGAEYQNQIPGEFFSSDRLTPWELPAALPYQSSIANQFRFACAEIKGFREIPRQRITLCLAMGQYGKYVSIFSTWISPEGMELGELEHILKAIDERMAQQVKDT